MSHTNTAGREILSCSRCGLPETYETTEFDSLYLTEETTITIVLAKVIAIDSAKQLIRIGNFSRC